MKPIIIYTMPRTRSTAALYAAKRDIKLNEPIEIFQLAKMDHTSQMKSLFMTRAENQSFADWNELQQQISNTNTVSKLFGSGLQQFYPARKWFNNLVAANNHDLYILLRNPKQILWSFVIALHYGFSLSNETDVGCIEVTDFDIFKADIALDNFLRFYPASGKKVTFETLPKENFDHSLANINEQNSINKIQFVKNKDYVDRNLDFILKFYEQEWKDKTGTDIFSFGITD